MVLSLFFEQKIISIGKKIILLLEKRGDSFALSAMARAPQYMYMYW